MGYKAFSGEVAQERSQHPQLNEKQAELLVVQHESIADVKDLTPRQKKDWYAKQIFAETRKEKPDWQAVRYYRQEMAKIPRGYLYPVVKK